MYMEKKEWTKTIGFRLPPSTLEQLDELIEGGKVRNRTEGVILAVDRMYYSEKHEQAELKLFNMFVELIAKYPEVYEVWKKIEAEEDNKS